MRPLSLMIPVLILLAACAAGDDASDDCVRAFRNAEPRAEAPYDASTLDDAIRDCGSIDEWRAAWQRVPSAYPAGTDPLEFLIDRCVEPQLAGTALCREVTAAT